jgi:hypothetical protein
MWNMTTALVAALVMLTIVAAAPAEAQVSGTNNALVTVVKECKEKYFGEHLGFWRWRVADAATDPLLGLAYPARTQAFGTPTGTDCKGAPTSYRCVTSIVDGGSQVLTSSTTGAVAVAQYKGVLTAIGTGGCAPNACASFDGRILLVVHLTGGCVAF